MRWTLATLVATITIAGSAAGAQSAVGPREPAPATVEAPAAAVGAGLEVRYLGNEGFLVEGAGRRVLVDALFGPGVTGYPVAPIELRAALERGAAEWGGVQVALASHHHPDHFEPGTVARFLAANPRAVFVSTPQAVAEIVRRHPGKSPLLERVLGVLPAAGEVERLELHGIAIDVVNLDHGPRSPPVENLGFVVTLGERRFLHFGDTEAKMDGFEPYLELLRGTDLALLPFWFLSSEWRAAMVRDRIRPRWIVAGHLPLPDAPAGHFARWQSYENLLRVIRDGFPEARIPGQPGESVCCGD